MIPTTETIALQFSQVAGGYKPLVDPARADFTRAVTT